MSGYCASENVEPLLVPGPISFQWFFISLTVGFGKISLFVSVLEEPFVAYLVT